LTLRRAPAPGIRFERAGKGATNGQGRGSDGPPV